MVLTVKNFDKEYSYSVIFADLGNYGSTIKAIPVDEESRQFVENWFKLISNNYYCLGYKPDDGFDLDPDKFKRIYANPNTTGYITINLSVENNTDVPCYIKGIFPTTLNYDNLDNILKVTFTGEGAVE